MKLFALAAAVVVLCCQLASGFMIAPSAFAGSSVVSPISFLSKHAAYPKFYLYPRKCCPIPRLSDRRVQCRLDFPSLHNQ